MKNNKIVLIILVLAIMLITALVEHGMGRLVFCKCGVVSVWTGNANGPQNSQQLFDPYTFTHIIHGFLFYLLLWLVFGKKLLPWQRLVLTVGLEGAWEILENTNFIIDKYRQTTVSIQYYGDSILNSMGDIIAMMTGFVIAWKLPVKMTVMMAIALELLMLFFLKDNLTINIIMLIHPIEAIQHWQMTK